MTQRRSDVSEKYDMSDKYDVSENHELDWALLIELCRSVENDHAFSELLDFLFTPEEKSRICHRIMLVKALLAGELTQREIAETYHISIAKITRGSNNLKRISPRLKAQLQSVLLGSSNVHKDHLD